MKCVIPPLGTRTALQARGAFAFPAVSAHHRHHAKPPYRFSGGLRRML